MVILLYFTSCENADEIGIGIQDDDVLVNTEFTDTVTVNSFVHLLDTVPTNILAGTNRWLLGHVESDTFGSTTATGYSEVLMPVISDTTFLTLGEEDATFDSAVISLPYSLNAGDPNASLGFTVYELSERLDTVNYYQSSSLAFGTQPLGRATLVPTQDSFNILRIRVDALGQKIFDRRGEQELSNAFFRDFVKGVAIVPDTMEDGYILAVRPVSQNLTAFNLRVFFSAPGDTLSSTRTFFLGNRFHQVTKDFTGTPLQGLEPGEALSTTQTANLGFVEYTAGLTTKVEFPSLDNFGQGRRLLINRAQLVFEPLPGSIERYGIPPVRLFLIQSGEDGRPAYFPNGQPQVILNRFSGQPVATDYVPGGRTYQNVDLTSYIQAVVDGEVENNGLFFGFTGGTQSLAKLLVAGAEYPGPEAVKLNIYYTVF